MAVLYMNLHEVSDTSAPLFQVELNIKWQDLHECQRSKRALSTILKTLVSGDR